MGFWLVKKKINIIRRKLQIVIKKISRSVKAIKINFTKTDYNRWKNVEKETSSWDDRNRIIASIIPAESTVLDLGAGAQTLRHKLKNCYYQPCDLISRSSDTLLCDFNKDKYPDIKQTYDYVVCSGLLEYIRSPRQFLEQIEHYGHHLLISYSIFLPNHSRASRLFQGWINHYTQNELEDIFQGLGLEWTICGRWCDQVIYIIKTRTKVC